MTSHYGTSHFNTKYKKVFYGEKDTGFEIVPSETQGMWRVKYPDGVLSKDHYNQTWAREHSILEARRTYEHMGERAGEAPPMRLNEVPATQLPLNI